jgi:DNA-binding HxlR family transcriptional regulator
MDNEVLDHSQCMSVLLPVRDALDVINGKWKLQIIIAITNGNKRFKDIERQIPGITARMLSKELKDLECHQLIKRTVYDTLPVTVEYTATPHAATLRPLIGALREWGLLHRKKILKK